MPKLAKAGRRDKQARKARHTTRTSRAFLHTLDRLAAERDRAKLYDANGERRPGVTGSFFRISGQRQAGRQPVVKLTPPHTLQHCRQQRQSRVIDR